MSKGLKISAILGGVFLLLIVMVVSSYNGFVSKDESVKEAFSQVDNQLQRRSDLIPNLVETVKGYADHEKGIMKDISEARSKLAGASTPSEMANADKELSGALSRLLVVVENYPNLKADKNYRQLMDELSGTENRIAVARKDYNAQVKSFNKKVKKFPGLVFANMFGFDEVEYFEADEGASEVPKIDFGGEGE